MLYKDTKACAEIIGLFYTSDKIPGIKRVKKGKDFQFIDPDQKPIIDKKIIEYILSLIIPPAWKKVWICPDQNGHIQVTGIDDKGRKQYLYHPKWRTMRDLIKFYRMILFAGLLPKIRKTVDEHLQRKGLNQHRVIAAMLWILDNTYIRVGNDIYYEQNESIGLTTLTDKNVVIAGSVVTFAFKGKSGKDHDFAIDDPVIAEIVAATKALNGERLFQYQSSDGTHIVTAAHINNYLREITNELVSAKDFRTWGGTLMAFNHLIENQDSDKKPEKLIVEAIDAAADILGNTRAVAKSSYVHPHILSTYGSKDFKRYYEEATKQRKIVALDKRESELLFFLQQLFMRQFDLLKSANL
ncbi:MAG: topoisomerase [Candidatus Saccharibacteria bacterium]|nr:topoisomerase [Candidatus Saccharibacteria bacterium]